MMMTIAIMFFTVACPEPNTLPAQRNLEPSEVILVDEDYTHYIMNYKRNNKYKMGMRIKFKFKNINVLTTAHITNWKMEFLKNKNKLFELNKNNFKKILDLQLLAIIENYDVTTFGYIVIDTVKTIFDYDIFKGKVPNKLKVTLYITDDYNASYKVYKIYEIKNCTR